MIEECEFSCDQSCPVEWPRCVPVLKESEIHIWQVPLSVGNNIVERLWRVLTAPEQDRANRILGSSFRSQFVVGRAAQHLLLSAYSGRPLADLRYVFSPCGKPSLDETSCHLQFNTTNAGSVAVYCVTFRRQVGVDIEPLRVVHEHEQIAQRFFSPLERAALSSVSPQLRTTAFLRIWTRKEAYIKATGEGLYRDLASFAVLEGADNAPHIWLDRDTIDARWIVEDLNVRWPGYVGTIVYEGPKSELLYFDAPAPE